MRSDSVAVESSPHTWRFEFDPLVSPNIPHPGTVWGIFLFHWCVLHFQRKKSRRMSFLGPKRPDFVSSAIFNKIGGGTGIPKSPLTSNFSPGSRKDFYFYFWIVTYLVQIDVPTSHSIWETKRREEKRSEKRREPVSKLPNTIRYT